MNQINPGSPESIIQLLSSLIPHPSSLLYRFAVIERLLALFQSDVGFFPGGLAALESPAPRHLAHIVNGPHPINFDLKDSLDRRFDLGLGRATIHTKGQQLASVL